MDNSKKFVLALSTLVLV